jgi:hypothetical protein
MVLISLGSRVICYTAGFLYPAYASYKCLSLSEALTSAQQDTTFNTTWANSMARRIEYSTATPGALTEGNTHLTDNNTTLDPNTVVQLEQSRWLTYWSVMAVWNSAEWVLDEFFSWIPFYHIGKVTFTLWMVLPHTNGALILYRRILEPYLVAHESEIDTAIQETTRRARGTILSTLYAGLQALTRLIFGNNPFARPTSSGNASSTGSTISQSGLSNLLSFVPLSTLASAASQSIQNKSFLEEDHSDFEMEHQSRRRRHDRQTSATRKTQPIPDDTEEEEDPRQRRQRRPTSGRRERRTKTRPRRKTPKDDDDDDDDDDGYEPLDNYDL